MKEIKYFGDSSYSNGGLVRTVVELMENPKLQSVNIIQPYTYFLTADEASKVKPDGFEWPVVIRPGRDGEFYQPITVANKYEDFERFVKELDERSKTILVSLPTPSLGPVNRNYYPHVHYYLARNYLLVQCYNEAGRSFVINTNNTAAFNDLGLDKNLVYRLASYADVDRGRMFAIDSIFEYGDPKLDQIKKGRYKDALSDDEATEQFIRGYTEGWKGGNAPSLGSRDFKSSFMTDGFSFGLIVGLLNWNMLVYSKRVFKMSSLYDFSNAFAIRNFVTQGSLESLEKSIKLHNAVVSSNRAEILESVKAIFLDFDKSKPVGLLLDAADTIANILFHAGSGVTSEPLMEIVGHSLSNQVTLSVEVAADSCQMRLINSDDNNASIRWQAETMRIVICKDDEGQKVNISEIDTGKLEYDFHFNNQALKNFDGPKNVSDLKKFFDEEDHTAQSQAGTEAKYVPAEIDGDRVISSNTKKLAFPVSIILDYIVTRGVITHPSIIYTDALTK